MERLERLLPAERKATAALAAVLSLRLLGFYAVLPVLSAYATKLPGATPLLAGLTVGVYALTQAVFQIPFGVLSDRLGRRRAIALGLVAFSAGSFAAARENVYWLITGRALQGTGAVASVVIALAADVTRPVARARAMGILGLAIGASLAIGMTAGPYLASRVGVPALFRVTGALALVAIVCVWTMLRDRTGATERPFSAASFAELSRRRELVVLNMGAFVLHLAVTFVFVVLPIALEAHLPWRRQWVVYPPIVAPAIVIMWVAMQHADRRGWARPMLWLGAFVITASFVLLASRPSPSLARLLASLALFASGVACMEPILPALLTRFAPEEARGTAAAIFNVCQFAGAFVGGVLGGHAIQLGDTRLFGLIAAIFVGWTLLATRLPAEYSREAREGSDRRASGR